MKTVIILIGLSVLLITLLGLVDKIYKKCKNKREMKTTYRIRKRY